MEFSVRDIFTGLWTWEKGSFHDYRQNPRVKNLIYCPVFGTRQYDFLDGTEIFLKPNEALFLPEGCRYLSSSLANGKEDTNSGLGISFCFFDEKNVPFSPEPVYLQINDNDHTIRGKMEEIVRLNLDPQKNWLKMYKTFFSLLDQVLAVQEKEPECYNDLVPALQALHRTPEIGYTNANLAQMCHLSESTFRRRFQQYSGGQTPQSYRMKLRIEKAEELLHSSATIEEIADLLGFCDAPHLCRAYKMHTGRTLREQRRRYNGIAP